jgi:hypothetical protein
MARERLDDFRDLSGWSEVASGQARLAISGEQGPSGPALRLDFDFRGGGGFVVARKSFPRRMPPAWALDLRVRGAAPANRLELKLVDPSNRNVWWWRREAFEFPAEWQRLRIRSSEVEFAWGPAGGGPLEELGALEIAIAAGPGGRGTVWIEDLGLEDLSLREPPGLLASSALPGHAPERVLDSSPRTSWRSEPGAPQWLALDFGREHEVGGLVIDWAPGGEPSAFDVQASEDGIAWTTLWSARRAEGARSHVALPGGARPRKLRLLLLEPGGEHSFGISALDLRPFEFSRSAHDFFHAVAANERRGLHPKWLYREQTSWSPVAVDGGSTCAILNEEGMLEPDRGSFSLEPFLWVDGELVTWADASVSQALARAWLPIPSSVWRRGDLALATTAFATGDASVGFARVRYRVENSGSAAMRVRLFAALRPFQVTPPWQAFQGLGGISEIRELAWRAGAAVVNGHKLVIPLTPADAFGAAAFEQGGVMRRLAHGELPARSAVRDASGWASGALCWDLALAPASAADVEVAIPFGEHPADPSDAAELRRLAAAATLEATERSWEEKLGGVRIRVAAGALEGVHTLRTATAHILVNRDGVALQPGPRRYTRSWIRDGATMAAALLRMGRSDEVRDFLRWYARHQAADGSVPCAVDRSGPDWLPEHDSHGQLAFTVAEVLRFTGDRAFAAELWPSVLRATHTLERLREQRLTPEFRTPEKRACYGILPESASHEGYLAHPVHSYWDDFWALRGLGDAAELATALGEGAEASRLAELRDSLAECLYASIASTISERQLDYVPGSVEWADFDPAATATAISTTDAARRLPPAALARTYDEYLRGFRRRRDGELEWTQYTAYEIRILGALVRMGRREEAHELLDFFLGDRRPRAWNQWPEISWRDPKSPGHLGDVPHAWIGAEFVLAWLGMLAYERVTDGALVLAAGVSDAWLDAGEVAVEGLPTWWGPLGYRLRREGPGALRLELAPGLRLPPGGIVIEPPLARPLSGLEVDGAPSAGFDARSATIRRCPASVLLRT